MKFIGSKYTPKCDYCGQRKRLGKSGELPDMLGFMQDNGKVVNLCSDCICKIGMIAQKDEKKVKKIIESLKA